MAHWRNIKKQADYKSACYGRIAAIWVNRLVYFEEYTNSEDAFIRERRMKKWKRAWKLKLIEKENPDWRDLADDWE